jgi:hypothetical protein
MRSICRAAGHELRAGAGVLALAALAACGGSHAAPADFGSASTTFPATMPPIPQVVRGSGPVMTGVHVVPMFFPNDPNQATFEAFLDAFAASPYWPQMVGEYAVGGDLTIDASVVLPSVPTDMDDYIALMQLELGSADAATLAQTVYLTSFSKLQVFDAGFGVSCEAFAGFHTAFAQTSGSAVSDAGSGSAVPNIIAALTWGCDSSITELTDVDVSTIVMTHEMIEAATDPLPNTAWGDVDAADAAWAEHFGGEVGDMCEGFPRRIYRPADLGFFIQRTWSNSEAMAFHDPCVPHIPDDPPFFATVPVEDTTDNGVRATNLDIPDGSATVELQFLADGATDADWIVEPIDEATLDGGPPQLELAVDRDSGQNGNLAHLTVTAADGAQKGLSPYRLLVTLDGIQNVWFGVVDIKSD